MIPKYLLNSAYRITLAYRLNGSTLVKFKNNINFENNIADFLNVFKPYKIYYKNLYLCVDYLFFSGSYDEKYLIIYIK